jgi:thioredoxin 1
LSQISGENLDKIRVCKVNIDENTDLAMEYRVLSIPTLAFFKDGELKGKLEGAVPKSVVEQKMGKYF